MNISRDCSIVHLRRLEVVKQLVELEAEQPVLGRDVVRDFCYPKLGLYVASSQFSGAGKGLFAAKAFAKGDIIAPYTGR